MTVDLRQLRYFLTVAAERSFTRAANRLNMAQPPLSKRIQELEAEMGAMLFDRESRPLRLTAAGQLLHEQAVQVLSRMDQLHEAMRRFVKADRHRFVIGLVPSTLFIRFPEVVARMRADAPDVDLALAEMGTSEQLPALLDGRINIGIDRMRVDDPALTQFTLREEPLIVALPAGHDLLRAGGPVKLADVAALPLIVYPRKPRPSYADLVLSVLHDHDLAPAIVHEVRELQTGLVMVAAGTGACIVPESVRNLGRPDIAFAAIWEPLTVPLILRYRSADRSPALRRMLQVFADLYAEWGWAVPSGLMAGLPT